MNKRMNGCCKHRWLPVDLGSFFLLDFISPYEDKEHSHHLPIHVLMLCITPNKSNKKATRFIQQGQGNPEQADKCRRQQKVEEERLILYPLERERRSFYTTKHALVSWDRRLGNPSWRIATRKEETFWGQRKRNGCCELRACRWWGNKGAPPWDRIPRAPRPLGSPTRPVTRCLTRPWPGPRWLGTPASPSAPPRRPR